MVMLEKKYSVVAVNCILTPPKHIFGLENATSLCRFATTNSKTNNAYVCVRIIYCWNGTYALKLTWVYTPTYHNNSQASLQLGSRNYVTNKPRSLYIHYTLNTLCKMKDAIWTAMCTRQLR